MLCHVIQSRAMRHLTIQSYTMSYNVIPYDTMLYNVIPYHGMPYQRIQCYAMENDKHIDFIFDMIWACFGHVLEVPNIVFMCLESMLHMSWT